MSNYATQKHEREELETQMEYKARTRYEMEEKKSDVRLITFMLVVVLACVLAAQIGFALKVW